MLILLFFLGGLLVSLSSIVTGLDVELRELLSPVEESVRTELEHLDAYRIDTSFGGVSPVDADCFTGLCRGVLTRDRSLELDSRYGCTVPTPEADDDFVRFAECGLRYTLSTDDSLLTIASVRVAFHPDSMTSLTISACCGATGEFSETAPEVPWAGEAGTTEFQDIAGVRGLQGYRLLIGGDLGDGEYLSILETEIYVTVDEVPVTGASATDRISVTAAATTDGESASATLDGDNSTSSAWTCSGESACEITYDLQAIESVEQIRIDFVEESTTSGGTFNVSAASDDGIFFSVLVGAIAENRAESTGTGLQTFGGVRALARYLKIEAAPASDGAIAIGEVDIRVGETSPMRPVDEKPWLKSLGMLPLGKSSTSLLRAPGYDERPASEGGCSNGGPFDGCHIFYIKDGDDSPESRWACSPVLLSVRSTCVADFDFNTFRYVRQIQLSFHEGDQHPYEFSIEAQVKHGPFDYDWVTVVPSFISMANTTDIQTFDLRVHAKGVRLVPRYQRIDQFFHVKEMVILERKDLNPEALPILQFNTIEDFDDDDYETLSAPESTSHFQFELRRVDNYAVVWAGESIVSGLRMKFPKDRVFTFGIDPGYYYDPDQQQYVEWGVETFTSAGGERRWETFELSQPRFVWSFRLIAIEGPDVPGYPDYPALKVGDFEVLGVSGKDPDTTVVVSSAIATWDVIPDVYCDGVSDQEEVMTIICNGKGATYDGVDCVGELDDSPVTVEMIDGTFYVDGPIYMKSGVTLDGTFDYEYWSYTRLKLADGPNTGRVEEDAMVVFDGVSGVEINNVQVVSTLGFNASETTGLFGDRCIDVSNTTAFPSFENDEPNGKKVRRTFTPNVLSEMCNVPLLSKRGANAVNLSIPGRILLTADAMKGLRFDDLQVYDCPSGGISFTDSENIHGRFLEGAQYANGNMLDFRRTDNFTLFAFSEMAGILIEDSTGLEFTAVDNFEVPSGGLEPPAGGQQVSHVVITGNSSGVIFRNLEDITGGAEPRILMETTNPLIMDFGGYEDVFEDVTPGECLIQVPSGATEDVLVQLNTEQPLSKSGNCFILEV